VTFDERISSAGFAGATIEAVTARATGGGHRGGAALAPPAV